jgi:transposase
LEVRETLAHLLPKRIALQLDACYLDEAHPHITLFVSSTQTEARCPVCDVPARHIHSHYARTLADLPWSDYGITWRLRIRKFFCRNAICPRRIFTERLPGIAMPWARRTLRLMAHLLAIGLYKFQVGLSG